MIIVDIVLAIGALIYRPSIWTLAIVAALIAMRRWPWLANAIAYRLELEQYDGMSRWAAHVALPAWRDMSSVTYPVAINPPPLVHVPIPGTIGSLDTNATIRDQFLVTMADQRDERGAYLFSANDIHGAIGGHRATVLAKVKDRRSATLPAQFRQEDNTTAPASYPVTQR